MSTLISNGRYPFEISFRHKFTFSKDVDRAEVETSVRFHIHGAPPQDDNKFNRNAGNKERFGINIFRNQALSI